MAVHDDPVPVSYPYRHLQLDCTRYCGRRWRHLLRTDFCHLHHTYCQTLRLYRTCIFHFTDRHTALYCRVGRDFNAGSLGLYH
ncbi:Uncharacterised protein [Vibrio cholerae]|nr:Uncharacterised protein [Vibrio cholerae]